MTPSRFDPARFADPPKAFRPLQIVHGFDRMLHDPDGLTGEVGITAYLDRLVALGVGGVVANVGFRDYLVSPRQWEIFRYGMQAAADRGMVLWWYDEKGYPSGTAGGLVTANHPEFASLGLACYHLSVTGPADVVYLRPPSCRAMVWVGGIQGDLGAACRERFVDLGDQVDGEGTLRWSAPAGQWTLLYLAERVAEPKSIPSGIGEEMRHYVNLLDPNVTAEFIRLTHEAYFRALPPDIWKRVRAVFTDEPTLESDYGVPTVGPDCKDRDRPPYVPWLATFPDAFIKAKGYDLRSCLYGLFCSESEEACYVRQDFYEVLTRVYVDAYYGQIAAWCRAHGIAASGHVLNEEWLGLHVGNHGSLFAVLRRMDLPGMDMLDGDPLSMLNGLGFLSAKQTGSVAHLIDAEEVHSECCDWVQHNHHTSANLPQRLGQGNLLYILGVNQITSYWGWGDIGEKAYRIYNDYMGRLALLLRGGRHVCDVAMLYPIRAAWATTVPHSPVPEMNIDGNRLSDRLDRIGGTGYAQPVRDLLRSQIDLDIIDEEAILEAAVKDGSLCIAQERYRIVVIPRADTVGAAALEKLAAFGEAGGRVLFIDETPVRAENQPASTRLRHAIQKLLASGDGRTVALDDIAAAVRAAGADDFRLAIPDPDILYTHRNVDGSDVYFLINGAAVPKRICPRLSVPGPYVLFRPLAGTMADVSAGSEVQLDGFEGVCLVRKPTSAPSS